MPLVFRYESSPSPIDREATVLEDLGNDDIRFGEFALTQAAQVGQAMTSQLTFDDDAASLNLIGHRIFEVRESSAGSNNEVIWRGRVAAREVRRGPSQRTSSARVWDCDLLDQNVLLSWRIFVDDEAKRPAESASDRLAWLLSTRYSGTSRLPIWPHPTYCSVPATAMDAADYRGQRYSDVAAEISNHTGYNHWVQYDQGRGHAELFFMDMGSDGYTSDLKISNDLADIDGVTVFAPSDDATLRRDPSRITAGAYVAYDGGAVYVASDTIGDQYAYVDQSAPLANVKSASAARAIGQRYIADNDEEDDRITCSIIVPAEQVNDIRPGHRLEAKFTHLPGYVSYRYVRVMKRTVIQDEDIGQDHYRLALELSPAGANPPGFLGHNFWEEDGSPADYQIDGWTPVAAGNTLFCFYAERGEWETEGAPHVCTTNTTDGTAWTLLEDYPGFPSGSGIGSSHNGVAAWTTESDGSETQVIINPGPGSSGAEVVLVGVSGTGAIVSDIADTLAAATTCTGPAVTPTAGQPAIIFGWFTQGSDFPNAPRQLDAGDGWTVLHSETIDTPQRWKPHWVLVYKIVDSASGSYAPSATSDEAFTWECITVAISL